MHLGDIPETRGGFYVMKKTISISTIVLFLIIGYFVLHKKDSWQAVYYPDGCLVCDEKYIYSPIFETEFECEDWVLATKSMRNLAHKNTEEDSAECGKNCETRESGMLVCDDTIGVGL